MNNNYNHTKSALVDIAQDVNQQAYNKSLLRPEWGGADVLITSKSKGSTDRGSFYPEPRAVVTPHAAEVGWLFNRLRDAFKGLIDGTSKIEFYGRLANAALDYQQSVNGNENAQDILKAILHEAYVMLEEMEENKFEYLLVAPGNTILADLIRQAEKSGDIGVEATEEFFRQMEEKHREAS